MEGRGAMTTAPISLQDLRRRLYGKAKAEKDWRGIARASAGRGGVRRGCTRNSGSSETTECSTEPMPESARRSIGRITLVAKLPGKRRTGNPSAPFEVAGVGDGLTANLHGHEAGNGGYSQGEPKGHRANPRPDRCLLARPAIS